jgi:hypothetical protein
MVVQVRLLVSAHARSKAGARSFSATRIRCAEPISRFIAPNELISVLFEEHS